MSILTDYYSKEELKEELGECLKNLETELWSISKSSKYESFDFLTFTLSPDTNQSPKGIKIIKQANHKAVFYWELLNDYLKNRYIFLYCTSIKINLIEKNWEYTIKCCEDIPLTKQQINYVYDTFTEVTSMTCKCRRFGG